MKPKTFYMNYAQGQGAPTVKYATFDEADREAKRLARMLRVEVFTLQAVRSVSIQEFTVTHFDTSEDLPF